MKKPETYWHQKDGITMISRDDSVRAFCCMILPARSTKKRRKNPGAFAKAGFRWLHKNHVGRWALGPRLSS